MTKPVQVVFRNIHSTPELKEEIRTRAKALETVYPRLVGCRVLLEVPHRHRQHGQHVKIRVELALPGEDVVIDHEREAFTDAHAAVIDAFETAKRRLQHARAAWE